MLMDSCYSVLCCTGQKLQHLSVKFVTVLCLLCLTSLDICNCFVYRLQQWLRRKTIDSPCEADSGPTASIRCPHGELLPEKATGARRLLIPESLWLFILESANTVKPNDSEGCSVFTQESEPCVQCSTVLTEEACDLDSMRLFRYIRLNFKRYSVLSFIDFIIHGTGSSN